MRMRSPLAQMGKECFCEMEGVLYNSNINNKVFIFD